MSEFRSSLRAGVDQAQQELISAWRAGNDDRAHAHAARLAELFELATRHGVDTGGWVDPAVRAYVDSRP